MQVQDFVELVNSPVSITDGTALASSSSPTVISPAAAGNPAQTIAANALYPGSSLLVYAAGRVSTTSTPNLTLGIYSGGAGGTKLADTGTIATTSSVTNVTWNLFAMIDVRAIGTSGSLFTTGWVAGISGTVGVNTVPLPASAPAGVTIDTTAAHTLDLVATWGTPSASNTITCHQWKVLALNVNIP